jgi:uncharacterized membrane protein YfcA
LTIPHLVVLAAIFFLTCVVTVVTGGTALITVPAMIMFGVPPRVALATNMVTLTLMSVGGTLPFLKGREIDWKRAPVLIPLTLVSSVAGALLVFLVPAEVLPLIIPFAMIAVLVFLLAHPRRGLHDTAPPSPARQRGGYITMFLLGIYGGFFSGGYVTMLMAAGIFFFGYSFLRSLAMSRLMNVASSSIATCVFAWHGAVEWKLAALMGCAAFGGAWAGARWARTVPEKLLRAVFITTVAALALKSLVFDVPWSRIA